jgi:hypothetical protein
VTAVQPVWPTTLAMAPKAPMGGQPQDHDEDLEHQLLQRGDGPQCRLTRGTHSLQRETDEQCDEECLQDAACGQRREQRLGDDALHEVEQAACFVRSLGEFGALARRALRQLQAASRVHDVADDEADGQGEGGHQQEVEEGQTTDLADGGGLADGPDAEHDRAEDDRRDHHLDQCHEHRAEDSDALAHVGCHQSDDHTRDDGDDDSDVEPVRAVTLLGLFRRRRRI